MYTYKGYAPILTLDYDNKVIYGHIDGVNGLEFEIPFMFGVISEYVIEETVKAKIEHYLNIISKHKNIIGNKNNDDSTKT